MSSEVASLPSYERTSSVRLKEALAVVPPLGQMRPEAKIFTQFQILDSLGSKFWALEQYHDESADQVPEGIGSFGRYFNSGVILPNGEMMLGHGIYEWRMRVMEYHAGWFVTILNGGSMRQPTFPVNPALWGGTIAGIQDNHIRTEATSRAICRGAPVDANYRDLLEFIHEVHRTSSMHRPNGTFTPSIVSFNI